MPSPTHLLKQPKVFAVQYTGPEQYEYLMSEIFAPVSIDTEGLHLGTPSGDTIVAVGDWIVKSLHPLISTYTWVAVAEADFAGQFDEI